MYRIDLLFCLLQIWCTCKRAKEAHVIFHLLIHVSYSVVLTVMPLRVILYFMGACHTHAMLIEYLHICAKARYVGANYAPSHNRLCLSINWNRIIAFCNLANQMCSTCLKFHGDTISSYKVMSHESLKK